MKMYNAIFAFSFCLHACQADGIGLGKIGGVLNTAKNVISSSNVSCPFLNQIMEARNECGGNESVTCEFLSLCFGIKNYGEEHNALLIEVAVPVVECMLEKIGIPFLKIEDGTYSFDASSALQSGKVGEAMLTTKTEALEKLTTLLPTCCELSEKAISTLVGRRSAEVTETKPKMPGEKLMCLLNAINTACEKEMFTNCNCKETD